MSNLSSIILIGVFFIALVLLILYSDKLFNRLVHITQLKKVAWADNKKDFEKELIQLADAPLNTVLEALSRLSVPKEGWQDSDVRLRFIRAGFREVAAPRTYYSIKSVSCMVLPAIVGGGLYFFVPSISNIKIVLIVAILSAVGYYLPDLYLKFRTKKRAARMQDGLPDFIDLLVVCTESGLGMDGAINRVCRAVYKTSQNLAEEFYLSALEIRAGVTRIQSLKNLALRVNLEDLNDLVSMLVQAHKFGTSLAESLRTQSEFMRVRRMQRAEEMAAKIPIKLLLPLILLLFPVMLMVILGPAIIQISKILGSD